MNAHTYSHSTTFRDVDGRTTLDLCACGAVWYRGECLGGHEEIVAFLKEVTA